MRLFLFGIVVGAVASLGLGALPPDAQPPELSGKWRSSIETTTPGSNINSEQTVRRSEAAADRDHLNEQRYSA